MTDYGVDLSHWNYPLDFDKLYKRLITMFPESTPFVIVKVSDGITRHPDGISAARAAQAAGFKNIGAYHFYNTMNAPKSQAATFLEQWDAFGWTIRPALDCEGWSGMPAPGSGYASDVRKWFAAVDMEAGAPSILYTNLSFANSYFYDSDFSLHPLWLSQPPASYKYLLPAPTCPLPWIGVTIWQRSYVNYLGGFYGSVSNEHIDIDLAAWIPRPGQGNPEPPDPPPPPPPPNERESRVVVDNLSVREGPGTQYTRTGFLVNGNIIEVLESSSFPAAPVEWVRHSTGWSCHHSTAATYMIDLS